MSHVFVKLRANRQKTKDKLGPEIGSVMAWVRGRSDDGLKVR